MNVIYSYSYFNSLKRYKRGRCNNVISYSIGKKYSKKYTWNRSPHGNKTSRDQFGIIIWYINLDYSNNMLPINVDYITKVSRKW